jgi:aspartate kinase
MKIFKFGGASVRDADAFRNVAKIIQLFPEERLVVVVSAMGKTTNHLEEIVRLHSEYRAIDFFESVDRLEEMHSTILHELFHDKNAPVIAEIASVFDRLKASFTDEFPENYDFAYDQWVSVGEIISSKILVAFLNQVGIPSGFSDARKMIRTDNHYREGKVNWEKTEHQVLQQLLPALEKKNVQVTQGFIGHTQEGFTTTLGREGSDYTAGILAYCLNAESVTIWKDVPGMLNADPKYFENTQKLDVISFKEAIELSYYGASVIHPKTIKPLQNKNIPLFVKSFLNPSVDGTVIQASDDKDHLIPSFIVKKDQILFSLRTKDFSFIVEENLGDIFIRLSKMNAKINLMQNSALDFSILLDKDKINVENFIATFTDHYNIRYNDALELVTIRHYNEETLSNLQAGKELILIQKTRQTARMVLK